MKKYYAAYLLSFALSVVNAGQASAQYALRNVNWWMTKPDVIAAEKRSPSQLTPKSLLFTDVSIGGYNADLHYRFAKKGLREVAYVLNTPHWDEARSYKDYQKLRQELSAKYGKPEDNELWSNHLYQGSPINYGVAASIGHVTFLSKWVKNSTLITLALTGKKFKCTNAITYHYHSLPVKTLMTLKKLRLADERQLTSLN